MATVPVLRPDTIATRPVGTPFQTAGNTAGAFGTDPAALMNAGKSLENAGDQFYKTSMQQKRYEEYQAKIKKEEDDKRIVRALGNQFDDQTRPILYGDETNPGYLSTEGQGALSAYPVATAGLKDVSKKLGEGLIDPHQRDLFDAYTGAKTSAYLDRMTGHYQQQRDVADMATFKGTLDNAQRQAADDPYSPDAVRQSLGMTVGTVNAQSKRFGWTPEQTSAAMANAVSGVHEQVVRSMVPDDPTKAEAYLKDNRQFIDGRQIPALDSLIKAQGAEGRAQLRMDMRDNLASIRDTGVPMVGLDARAAGFLKPAELSAYKREADNAAAYHRSTAEVQFMTPQAMQDRYQELKGAPGSQGYADRLESANQFLSAAQGQLSARAQDPAAAAAGSTKVLRAAELASRDPSKSYDYAKATLAQQEAMGVPAAQQRVLTKGQATSIVQSVFNGTADKWADQIDGMQTAYGDAWPKVWKELVAAKMPVEAEIFGTFSRANPADAIPRHDFGQALKVGRDDLEAGLQPEDKKKIGDQVAANLQVWAQSESARGGDRNISAMRSSSEMLAYYYRNNQGMSATAAANKATNALVLGRYDVMTGNYVGFNMSVDKGYGRATYDMGSSIRVGLKPENLVDPGGDPQLDSNARKQNYASRIQGESQWVVDRAGQNAVLLDGAGQPVMRLPPDSFDVAKSEMDLNQQEQNLYQTHLSNLKNGSVHNEDGSTSTLRDVTVERDGRTVVIPTVWNGRVLPPEAAVKEAAKKGWDYWPSYATQEEADQRYNAMHDYMERDVAGQPVSFPLEAAKHIDYSKTQPGIPDMPMSRTSGDAELKGGAGNDTLGVAMATPPEKPSQATLEMGTQAFADRAEKDPIANLGADPAAVTVLPNTQAWGAAGSGSQTYGEYHPGNLGGAMNQFMSDLKASRPGSVSGPGSNRKSDAVIVSGANSKEFNDTVLMHELRHRGLYISGEGKEGGNVVFKDFTSDGKTFNQEDVVRLFDYITDIGNPETRQMVKEHFDAKKLDVEKLLKDDKVLSNMMLLQAAAASRLKSERGVDTPIHFPK